MPCARCRRRSRSRRRRRGSTGPASAAAAPDARGTARAAGRRRRLMDAVAVVVVRRRRARRSRGRRRVALGARSRLVRVRSGRSRWPHAPAGRPAPRAATRWTFPARHERSAGWTTRAAMSTPSRRPRGRRAGAPDRVGRRPRWRSGAGHRRARGRRRRATIRWWSPPSVATTPVSRRYDVATGTCLGRTAGQPGDGRVRAAAARAWWSASRSGGRRRRAVRARRGRRGAVVDAGRRRPGGRGCGVVHPQRLVAAGPRPGHGHPAVGPAGARRGAVGLVGDVTFVADRQEVTAFDQPASRSGARPCPPTIRCGVVGQGDGLVLVVRSSGLAALDVDRRPPRSGGAVRGRPGRHRPSTLTIRSTRRRPHAERGRRRDRSPGRRSGARPAERPCGGRRRRLRRRRRGVTAYDRERPDPAVVDRASTDAGEVAGARGRSTTACWCATATATSCSSTEVAARAADGPSVRDRLRLRYGRPLRHEPRVTAPQAAAASPCWRPGAARSWRPSSTPGCRSSVVLVDRPCRALDAGRRVGRPRRARRPGPLRRRVRPRRRTPPASSRSCAPATSRLVAMAGFMTVLARPIFDVFPGRVLNTHPSLLPAFPGAHAVRDALADGVKVTGCTVHVATEQVDHGPILAQEAVAVLRRPTTRPASTSASSRSSVASTRGDRGGPRGERTSPHPHPAALLSVYDKTGVVELAGGLHALGWRLVSSGGTAQGHRRGRPPVTDVAELTGVPGHPRSPGRDAAPEGARRHPRRRGRPDSPSRPRGVRHRARSRSWWPTSTRSAPQPGIEMIDIGGPAMVRAAAKNHAHVGVVVDPPTTPAVLASCGAGRAVGRHPAAPGPRRRSPTPPPTTPPS